MFNGDEVFFNDPSNLQLCQLKVDFLIFQIHDATDCFVLDGHWMVCWFHHRRHSSDLEQVGSGARVRVRSDLLSMVHGRRHYTRVLTRMAVHALRVLSDMARGVKASKAAPNDGPAGRNVGLEIGASKKRWKLHNLIAYGNCFSLSVYKKAREMLHFNLVFDLRRDCITLNPSKGDSFCNSDFT